MASDTETQEEIIAEIRKESNKVWTVTRPDGYGGYEGITLEGNPYLKSIADRLDAARRREIAEHREEVQSLQSTIRKLTAAIAEQGEEVTHKRELGEVKAAAKSLISDAVMNSKIAVVHEPGNAAIRSELLNCKTLFASLALQNGDWRTAANGEILRIEAALKSADNELLSKTSDSDNSGSVVVSGGKQVNAAAMREALEKILSIANTFMAETRMRHVTDSARIDVGVIEDVAKAALSAPLRNCDLFGGDYKMLHTAWFDWTGSPSGHLPDGTSKMTFAAWLLAPAAERKGVDA